MVFPLFTKVSVSGNFQDHKLERTPQWAFSPVVIGSICWHKKLRLFYLQGNVSAQGHSDSLWRPKMDGLSVLLLYWRPPHLSTALVLTKSELHQSTAAQSIHQAPWPSAQDTWPSAGSSSGTLHSPCGPLHHCPHWLLHQSACFIPCPGLRAVSLSLFQSHLFYLSNFLFFYLCSFSVSIGLSVLLFCFLSI